jgi:hypothetical protein
MNTYLGVPLRVGLFAASLCSDPSLGGYKSRPYYGRSLRLPATIPHAKKLRTWTIK